MILAMNIENFDFWMTLDDASISKHVIRHLKYFLIAAAADIYNQAETTHL